MTETTFWHCAFPRRSQSTSWRKTWQSHVHYYLGHTSLSNKLYYTTSITLFGLPVVIPCKPLASMSSTSGNYCPTGHGRHVSITTTLVPISVFARCLVASRFHSIPGELLTSLGTSSLRSRRTFKCPTQPSLQPAAPSASGAEPIRVVNNHSPRIHDPCTHYLPIT